MAAVKLNSGQLQNGTSLKHFGKKLDLKLLSHFDCKRASVLKRSTKVRSSVSDLLDHFRTTSGTTQVLTYRNRVEGKRSARDRNPAVP